MRRPHRSLWCDYLICSVCQAISLKKSCSVFKIKAKKKSVGFLIVCVAKPDFKIGLDCICELSLSLQSHTASADIVARLHYANLPSVK